MLKTNLNRLFMYGRYLFKLNNTPIIVHQNVKFFKYLSTEKIFPHINECTSVNSSLNACNNCVLSQRRHFATVEGKF